MRYKVANSSIEREIKGAFFLLVLVNESWTDGKDNLTQIKAATLILR
jgi:hypothetical protein